MKSLLRLFGFIVLFLLCLPAARGQFSSIKVLKIEIKHVGPAQVSDDLIRANIRVKAGDLYRAG